MKPTWYEHASEENIPLFLYNKAINYWTRHERNMQGMEIFLSYIAHALIQWTGNTWSWSP